jgi:hypothetical protein
MDQTTARASADQGISSLEHGCAAASPRRMAGHAAAVDGLHVSAVSSNYQVEGQNELRSAIA